LRTLQDSSRASVARRTLAIVLVLLLTTGCSSMRPLRGSPETSIARLPEDARIRVVLKNGERVDLQFVSVRADSVRGLARDRPNTPASHDPGETHVVAYALADVLEIQAVQPDTGKTVGLVVAGVVVAVVVLAGMAIGELGNALVSAAPYQR